MQTKTLRPLAVVGVGLEEREREGGREREREKEKDAHTFTHTHTASHLRKLFAQEPVVISFLSFSL